MHRRVLKKVCSFHVQKLATKCFQLTQMHPFLFRCSSGFSSTGLGVPGIPLVPEEGPVGRLRVFAWVGWSRPRPGRVRPGRAGPSLGRARPDPPWPAPALARPGLASQACRGGGRPSQNQNHYDGLGTTLLMLESTWSPPDSRRSYPETPQIRRRGNPR